MSTKHKIYIGTEAQFTNLENLITPRLRSLEKIVGTLEDSLPEVTDLEEWAETHFEIISRILEQEQSPSSYVGIIATEEGTGGLYSLSFKLTNEFHATYKNTVWGEELIWIDTLEEFLSEKLNNNTQQ